MGIVAWAGLEYIARNDHSAKAMVIDRCAAGFPGGVVRRLCSACIEDFLDEAATRRFDLGVRYAAIHALAIMIGAVALPLAGRPERLLQAMRSLLAGIGLFSGSLLLLALTGLKGFAILTPLGGLALLIGWGLFAFSMRARDGL